MNLALQSALLRLYREVAPTGILSTRAGGWIFRWAYMLYKRRLEAGPIELLRQWVKPGALVIDVGANIGFFTRHFGRWVLPHGRVIAIEPEPSNLRCLERLVEGDGLAGAVEVVAGVAAAATGALRLTVNPHHPGDHKIGDHGLPVAAYALDDLMAERGWPAVSLIKIDVQGAEERVIDGARMTIERRAPALFVEVHDVALRALGSSAERLLDRVVGMGYALHVLRADGTSPALSVGQVRASIGSSAGYVDLLCLPTRFARP